jgi:hypothetical protein
MSAEYSPRSRNDDDPYTDKGNTGCDPKPPKPQTKSTKNK